MWEKTARFWGANKKTARKEPSSDAGQTPSWSTSTGDRSAFCALCGSAPKMDPPFLLIMVYYGQFSFLFFFLSAFSFLLAERHQDTNLFGKINRRRGDTHVFMWCPWCPCHILSRCHGRVNFPTTLDLSLCLVGFESISPTPSPQSSHIFELCYWGRWIPPEDIAKFGEENHGGFNFDNEKWCFFWFKGFFWFWCSTELCGVLRYELLVVCSLCTSRPEAQCVWESMACNVGHHVIIIPWVLEVLGRGVPLHLDTMWPMRVIVTTDGTSVKQRLLIFWQLPQYVFLLHFFHFRVMFQLFHFFSMNSSCKIASCNPYRTNGTNVSVSNISLTLICLEFTSLNHSGVKDW